MRSILHNVTGISAPFEEREGWREASTEGRDKFLRHKSQ